jgi:hypothetical protein
MATSEVHLTGLKLELHQRLKSLNVPLAYLIIDVKEFGNHMLNTMGQQTSILFIPYRKENESSTTTNNAHHYC